MRPGRLDRILYVPLPDINTRREIFSINLRKMPVSDSLDTESLVTRTHSYSGAEVSIEGCQIFQNFQNIIFSFYINMD